MESEKFNDVGPCPVCPDMEIEQDSKKYPANAGKLWMGSSWLTVAQAREMRDWLNKVIP